MSSSSFATRVYHLLRTVPPGKVTTYRALATALGSRAYRAVGQAMKHNPDAPTIPCHRVVRSDGRIGGFNGQTSGPALQRKIALLQKEGITVKNGHIQTFPQVCMSFQ